MNAPEFPKNLKWFNSNPLTISELKGKAMLIDFWTYSCVNCIRTLPHLKDWHEKYQDKGLVIIGVHTPEFEFEKQPENVEKAIKDFEIKYPVVMDNDYLIWNLYANHWWPRKFLVNKDGKIVYDHIGEGGYKETEEEIQKALKEIDPNIKLPSVAEAIEGKGGICYPTTPETYLGSDRGFPGKVWNFHGDWKIYPQYIQHTKNTKDFSEYISLNYEASEVNLVLGTSDGKPAKIKIVSHSDPPTGGEESMRDPSVTPQDDGEIIIVDRYKMYNLLKLDKHSSGELKIYSNSDNLQAYAFTFGGCE